MYCDRLFDFIFLERGNGGKSEMEKDFNEVPELFPKKKREEKNQKPENGMLKKKYNL